MKSQGCILKSILVFALILSVHFPTQAQQTTETQSQGELQNRVRELESQIELMKSQLEDLKKAVDAKNQSTANQQNTSQTTQVAKPETPKQETKPVQKETSQQGVDLGAVRVTPYGTIYLNVFGNSRGTNNADIPLFATSSSAGNMSASVRQTRLGLKISGPTVWKAKSSGVVEADFFGGFPAVGLGENFGVVRVRLAYARLDWKKTSAEAGQDWAVFAPNNPVSIASAAIPQLAAAGNPWARLPQLRVEHRFDNGVMLQGAVLSPSTGDFPSNTAVFFLQAGAGAASRMPAFESRFSYNNKDWLGTKKAGSVGVSMHYGRARVSNTIESVGVALDWNSPLHKRVSLTGEAFFGRNLAMFQSGVFQGYNSTYIISTTNGVFVLTGARAIGTRGGWSQLGWNLPTAKDRITLYGSIGIDDPRDEDLRSVSVTDWRKRNLAYSFSLHYKYSPQFTWALEFRRLETVYMITRKQTANHLNLGVAYTF